MRRIARPLITGTALLLAAMALGPAVSDLLVSTSSLPPRVRAAPGLYFDYLVIILMENKNLCEIYTHCGGSGTYMTSLADAYAASLDERYCRLNPSLPNYLCLSGGTTFGCTTNVAPNTGCATAAWDAPSIVDRLETGGLSWKAYMEDMPANCYGVNSGLYVVRHNPFVYYRGIAQNATRCNRVVPSGTTASVLVNDLASVSTASNYMWLTPNNCNNMHDCSIATGDTYLAGLIPPILSSTVFTTTRAALLVTFDEGYGEPTYAVWAGPVVKQHYTSTFPYDHYSVLKTIEANWDLAPLTSNDRDAESMYEFFVGQPPRPQPSRPPSFSALAVEIALLLGISGVVLAIVLAARRPRSRRRT